MAAHRSMHSTCSLHINVSRLWFCMPHNLYTGINPRPVQLRFPALCTATQHNQTGFCHFYGTSRISYQKLPSSPDLPLKRGSSFNLVNKETVPHLLAQPNLSCTLCSVHHPRSWAGIRHTCSVPLLYKPYWLRLFNGYQYQNRTDVSESMSSVHRPQRVATSLIGNKIFCLSRMSASLGFSQLARRLLPLRFGEASHAPSSQTRHTLFSDVWFLSRPSFFPRCQVES